MTELFTWKDGYALGIDEIDQQHLQLFQLINNFGKMGPERTQDALLDYLQTHFASEEAFMCQAEYPDLTTHKQAHDKCLETVLGDGMAGDDGEALFQFLIRWLLDHLLGEDQRFGAFYRSRTS